MTDQDQGASDGAQAGGTAITQADRRMWQRQAAAMLEHLVRQHVNLPALNWYLSWVGNLRAHVGSEKAPGEARATFAAWSTALGLDDQRELPGTGGALARAHGRARWGSVAVSVTASVRPSDSGALVPDATANQGKATMSATSVLIPAVDFLAKTLRDHQDLGAVTWLVRPSGALHAWVRDTGSPVEAGSLFRRWQLVLLPGEPAPMAFHDGGWTGLQAEGWAGRVRVTLEATVGRTRSHHQPAKSAQPVRSRESPRPASPIGRLEVRPGTVARHRATRPSQHPPMRGSERHGPTPRPS